MEISFYYQSKNYTSHLSHGYDISIPLISNGPGPRCFFAPPVDISPVIMGDFIGATAQGSPVNFMNVRINPHGNGTHTECVGHISKDNFTIHECLTEFHFVAQLVTVEPLTNPDGDRTIDETNLSLCLDKVSLPPAVIIRTLPNGIEKKTKDYSGTNAPYFTPKAIKYLVDHGVKHLITDLPSIDKEEDGGQLSSHKAFWGYPDQIDASKTISELVYIDEDIRDGQYLCTIQIISIMSDASPSKIMLYDMNLVDK